MAQQPSVGTGTGQARYTTSDSDGGSDNESQYNDDVEADFSTEIDPAVEVNAQDMSAHQADHPAISPPGAQQQPLPTSPSLDATPDSSPLHLAQPQHSQTPAAFRSRGHPSPSRRTSKDALGVDDSPPAAPPTAHRQQAKPAEQHKAQQRVPSPVHDQDAAAARDQAQPVASRVPSGKDGGYGAAAHAPGLPRQQYLTDMFASSMEFARSGKVITQQQAQIDLLSERLAAANAARRSLEEELQQIATANQESEQRLREVYEARLAEAAQAHEAQLAAKSREVVRLLAEVARLKDAGAKGKVLTKSVAGVTLSGEELAGLRRELEEQETLLRGYQAESEASAARIKELEGALREASLVHVPTLPAHEPRPAAAGLMVHQREAAQRLQEVLSLQAQLEALKETSSARELELKAQLDKVRAEKKELEARSAGVDLKMIQEGDVLVKQVQAEMETMRGQYTAMIAELQNKLRWYSENQELLTKNDTLVREQQQVIAQLEERLAQAEGSSGSQGKAKQSRVKELSQQVASLQAALRARVPPNSLAALVQASKPSLEETAAMQALHARVAALTAQLAAKDEEYEVQLRAYQQQYEQLRARFEERQASLEGAARARKREKELAAQVEELRSMYTRKLRDMEAKLKAFQASQPLGPAHAGQRVSTARGSLAAALEEDLVPAGMLRQKEAEARRLGQELDRVTRQVAELHLRLGEAEAMALRASTSVPASPHQRPSNRVARGLLLPPGRTTDSPNVAGWGPSDSSQTQAGLQEEAAILRQRCSALTSEVFHLRRQLEDMEQRQMQRNQRHQDPEQAAQAAAELEAAIRRAAAAEMALGTVQKAHTEAVERASQMAVEHQRALLTMHDEVAYKEGVRWQERLNAAQAETRTARDKIAQLESELATMASRLRSNWAPQAADFAALERKIDGMAAEQAARDAQWRVVLSETRELYAVQAQVAEKKALALVAAKQQELELLKGQVDELIVQFATAQ